MDVRTWTRRRMLGALFVSALLTGSAVWGQPQESRTPAATEFGPNGPCRVAGTFLVTAPAFFPDLGDQPLLAVVTIGPSDPTCRRFTISLVPVNPELSFAGIFPEATDPPGLFGSIVREGGSYRIFGVAPSPGVIPDGLPVRAPVLYFWTYRGVVECVGGDCDELLLDGVARLYSSIDDPEREVPELGISGLSDQDRDDDGFADDGEEPILVAPFPLPGRRVMPPAGL